LRHGNLLATLLVLSIAINSILTVAYLSQLHLLNDVSTKLQSYAETSEELSAKVAELSYQLNLTLSQLEFYKNLAENLPNATWSGEEGWIQGASTVNLVAVKSTPTGLEGVTLQCEVKLLQGSGRILVDTEPRIGIDLQASVRTAVQVAEQLTGVSLNETDVVVRVRSSEEERIEVVDGPSAGAAITVAVISAIRGEPLNASVYMTGTINPDGSIGWVGGILEKALAAARGGGKLFIIPKGQRLAPVWVVVRENPMPGLVIERYELRYVDVEEYLHSQGYHVEVIELEHVEEAYPYFTGQELKS